MQELLEKREEVSDKIECYIDQYVADWYFFFFFDIISILKTKILFNRGVYIENVFIKDMVLSREL